jgi:hypothetical protein
VKIGSLVTALPQLSTELQKTSCYPQSQSKSSNSVVVVVFSNARIKCRFAGRGSGGVEEEQFI